MRCEIVNPVEVEEVGPWLRSMVTTFLGNPHGAQTNARIERLARNWDPERAWGARAGARWVGTLRSDPRTVTVPAATPAATPGSAPSATLRGAAVPLAVEAVTNVTVAATHRRQGVMSSMLNESLRAARERGDPLSMLISAEWPIYGRFGYAPATKSAAYTLRRSRGRATADGDPTRVRQVELDELADHVGRVFAAARRARGGQVDRDGAWWDRLLGRDGGPPSDTLATNWFLHDGDEGVDGVLGWTGRGDHSLVPPFGAIDVAELIAVGDEGYRDLWAYLGGLDGADEVHLSVRPVDEPVRWLLPDARTLVLTEQVDFLWVRLLDIERALSARGYAIPGEIVIEVLDPHGELACGRFRLEAAAGTPSACTATSDASDVTITQRALASIYLGGYRLRELGVARMADEHTPGALDRLDVMFSTPLAPWNATWF